MFRASEFLIVMGNLNALLIYTSVHCCGTAIISSICSYGIVVMPDPVYRGRIIVVSPKRKMKNGLILVSSSE
jgi:hypothetical protein